MIMTHTNLTIDKMFENTLNCMIAGAAFMDPRAKVYEIYSHAGDHIATMPIFMVESTIAWMRKNKNIEASRIYGTDPRPGLTFAW